MLLPRGESRQPVCATEPTEGADGSLTVKLQRGLDISGAKITELRLREPSIADQLAAQSGGADDAAAEVALLANIAELTPDELRTVKLRDYGRLQKALGFFYG